MNKIFEVTASILNLRPHPRQEASPPLAKLKKGQVVVRLDDAAIGDWYLVFADVSGDGIYVGYCSSRYLHPLDVDLQLASPIDLSPALDGDDDDPTPARDAAGGLHEDLHQPTDPVAMAGGWHPEIPEEDRYEASSAYYSPRNGADVRRIVIHVTGTPSFDAVRKRFTEDNAHASAHYVIKDDGTLTQFVSEQYASHHSGIRSFVKPLYRAGRQTWMKYLRFFQWAYDDGWYNDEQTVFVDANFNILPSSVGARFVARRDGSDWPHYDFFKARWPDLEQPVGFTEDNGRPNHHSIGIEILSVGSSRPSETAYTPAMYHTLSTLVSDICARHNIPKRGPYVVGHEDINPVERWGWDPANGFDWQRILDAE